MGKKKPVERHTDQDQEPREVGVKEQEYTPEPTFDPEKKVEAAPEVKPPEEPTKVEPTKAVAKTSTFNPTVSEIGQIVPRSLDEMKGVAAAYLNSKLLPTRYENVAQVITAMQMAIELGLKPLTALRQIAVINGVPSLFGDLPLSLCLNKGVITYIEEFLVDSEYQPLSWKNKNLNAEAYAAICILKRRGQRTAREFFFTMDDAKKAGLFPGKNPEKPWAKYTRYMLKYRARSQGLKDLAADALNGLSIAEYDHNIIPDTSGAHNPRDLDLDAAAELALEMSEHEVPNPQLTQ